MSQSVSVHNPPGLTKFVVQRMVQANPQLQQQTALANGVQHARGFSDLAFVIGTSARAHTVQALEIITHKTNRAALGVEFDTDERARAAE